jgi:hypothetical protein
MPLDEELWQSGNIHSNGLKPNGPQCHLSEDENKRYAFLSLLCHNCSLFGFFLPLMTMTRELIDLNQARNHPMLGASLDGNFGWNTSVSKVLHQLEMYRASLNPFAATISNPIQMQLFHLSTLFPNRTT